jgi:Holliday junction DNA helicase RuvA
MISHIKGILERVCDNAVVIDVNGLGYMVHIPKNLTLPALGDTLKLYTVLYIKEDQLSLFGFTNLDDKAIFELLISVSGVGPKAALAVLSIMDASQISEAIVSNDSSAFTKAQGVGKRIAERIALELKDKVNNSFARPSLDLSSANRQDALDALISLGYSRSEAVKAVLEVDYGDLPVEKIIRLSLKKLVSGR